MMNKYININRLEFAVTKQCSGHCKHCSVDLVDNKGSINPELAENIVAELAGVYSINSVMTFGGEPLLYSDTVCRIHKTAYKNNIERRDIITNGFFSNDYQVIDITAQKICDSNISKIMLSVDAFHQEKIPIEPVIKFAESLLKYGFKGLVTHPAWLVNKNHDNQYNKITNEILETFEKLGIKPSNGNNIFPAGNAVKYLHEYFPRPDMDNFWVPCGTLPYTGKIDEIDSICVDTNGDIMICSFSIGNIHRKNILEIIEQYDPYKNKYTRMLIEKGIKKLYDYVNENEAEIDINDCYTPCMVCHKIMKRIREKVV